MADAVLSASRRPQQPNGQPSPFSPCRRAGGGGGPFPDSPPPDPELPSGEEPLDGRWRPREAPQPGGCPDGEGAAPPPPPAPPAGASQGCAGGGGPPEEAQCPGGGPGGPRWRAAPGGEEERQLGKKKHRRRPSKKKRHWKPYYQLSWEEKKKFDEKQSQRASRLRAEMFAKGQPVAPYNTTQFLMEDHDTEEPDLKTAGPGPKRAAGPRADDDGSSGADEDFCDGEGAGGEALGGVGGGMGGDGSEFLQKDFSETYERYHVESLQNMSKQELVREYLELEKCLSRLEDENNRLRLLAGGDPDDLRLRQLEHELDSLRAENQRLLRENQLLRGPQRENKPPASQAAAAGE
ncbi:UNVERIFIED_CONTAM: hypothetical protein K2H54_003697 [Gekko kuhli]